ncbi:TadE/TadG family type IV pilus assembly protein [Pseudidiomarina homiensis]|uniref:TadE/TadG family type IV pilus assembly protein n=1 Tax=Pseudidiomarina homiensis TaxID=364198 RepID=UPI00215B1AE0|nr:pilus assembly protein [Pseudidiomarina homiensis]
MAAMFSKWWMPVSLRTTKQKGQALVESLIVFPILLVTTLLVTQLLWIALAHATVQTATNYSARAGTINHGQRAVMERTFIVGMASLVPQWFTSLPPSTTERWQAQLAATARQWARFQWAGKLQILRPTAQVLQEHAEQRYDLASEQWVNELAVDHASLRLAEAADAKQWQAARTLEIEVWWCLRLQVPLAAALLAALKNANASAAQQFCHSRQMLSGQPLWALEHKVAYPLLSGYRVP